MQEFWYCFVPAPANSKTVSAIYDLRVNYHAAMWNAQNNQKIWVINRELDYWYPIKLYSHKNIKQYSICMDLWDYSVSDSIPSISHLCNTVA